MCNTNCCFFSVLFCFRDTLKLTDTIYPSVALVIYRWLRVKIQTYSPEHPDESGVIALRATTDRETSTDIDTDKVKQRRTEE